MSRAFDTIKRRRILDVLLQAGSNNDELRLIRAMLAGTKLWVRVKNDLSDSFETSIGSPHAATIPSVRKSSNRSNPPVSSLRMPLEMEYAYDVDFLDEENKSLDHLQSLVAETSWAVPKAMLNKLEAGHRRHLRTITGHCWPNYAMKNPFPQRLQNKDGQC